MEKIISETSHNTTSIQVDIVQSGEVNNCHYVRDMKGTFLVTPPLPVVTSRSPTPSHGDSDYKEGAESFTAEMTQLENVLQMLEEKLCSYKLDFSQQRKR